MPIAVIVSGPPGAGKTSVALPLAANLVLPLLSKDVIKEQLYDVLPAPATDGLAWSRTLGGAAMELLWTLAQHSPRVILEANFRPRSTYERGRLEALGRPVVEVYCDCPPELAARRFNDRALRPEHHRGAHPMVEIADEFLREFDAPMGLGTVIRLDTSQPVDHAKLATDVALAASLAER